MKNKATCRFHPDRPAVNQCAGCGAKICEYCSQAIIMEEYYCHLCALFTPGTFVRANRRRRLKFMAIILAALLIAMYGVVLLTTRF